MNLSDNVLQNKMIVPECHGSIILFSVDVLLVSSKEVLVSSPEIEARSAAVYGKRGLASVRAGRRSRADISLLLVVCQDINSIRICLRSLELT